MSESDWIILLRALVISAAISFFVGRIVFFLWDEFVEEILDCPSKILTALRRVLRRRQ